MNRSLEIAEAAGVRAHHGCLVNAVQLAMHPSKGCSMLDNVCGIRCMFGCGTPA